MLFLFNNDNNNTFSPYSLIAIPSYLLSLYVVLYVFIYVTSPYFMFYLIFYICNVNVILYVIVMYVFYFFCFVLLLFLSTMSLCLLCEMCYIHNSLFNLTWLVVQTVEAADTLVECLMETAHDKNWQYETNILIFSLHSLFNPTSNFRFLFNTQFYVTLCLMVSCVWSIIQLVCHWCGFAAHVNPPTVFH